MTLWLAFVILLASIPIGYLLKYLTKDEIKAGKHYFNILWAASLALAILFLFIDVNNEVYKKSIIFSLLFIANVAFISWKR